MVSNAWPKASIFPSKGWSEKGPKREGKKNITVYEPFKPSEVQQEEAPISGNVVVKTDQ